MASSLLKTRSGTCLLIRFLQRRLASDLCEQPEIPCEPKLKGAVFGLYTDPDERDHPGKFTPTADVYDQSTGCRLKDLLRYSHPLPTLGQTRLFYNVNEEFGVVCVVGLGKECQGYDVYEQMDEGKEAIRIASAAGCKALQPFNFHRVYIESFGHAESSAEGAALGVWLYQEKRRRENRVHIPGLVLYNDCDYTGWQIGLQKAAAQNLARQLTDTSANILTPTSFAQNAVEVLCKTGINVEVKVRGWCEQQQMNAFLLAAQGSCEPPIFLELSYYGAGRDERPVVIVAKGVTYNSGGMCILSCKRQDRMRGDMAGAACVVAALRSIADLQLPINIRALIPLCENMPGCGAMRPGDIVKAMNGKTIQITSTDCAGRLAMADALCYASTFWPRFIVDVGASSWEIENGIGNSASAIYSNSQVLYEYMLAASMHTGDRIWRFPLWKHFKQLMIGNHNCDVRTTGKSEKSKGNPCRMAAFLNEFVPCGDWVHVDMRNVIWASGDTLAYYRQGMSGRPTRTLVEFLSQLVCHREG